MNLIAIYFQGNEYLLDPDFADLSDIRGGYRVATETELIIILEKERNFRQTQPCPRKATG
ncbi:hypothetical protein ACFQ4C_06890 [Larkinella insperata]|uniref:Uncharacterized protein n=1 Tax=Larkinella insperata TaxID=332158 RepID=A0ABW3Q5W0_9BACT